MPAMNKPILMRFPLIGEWNTPNTPGSRIPSHGTNALGTRYAYDFLQLNWKKRGHPCYRSHVLSYLLFGVALSSCYCYGLPVYAPCDGRVVYVMDGCRERKRAWFFSDALMAFKNSRRRQDQEICEISGNAVIIQYTGYGLCRLLSPAAEFDCGGCWTVCQSRRFYRQHRTQWQFHVPPSSFPAHGQC